MMSPREEDLPFGSPPRLAFLALPAVRSVLACLAALSAAGGGAGVPSSAVATAAASNVPNSAASFSARLEALSRLLSSG